MTFRALIELLHFLQSDMAKQSAKSDITSSLDAPNKDNEKLTSIWNLNILDQPSGKLNNA